MRVPLRTSWGAEVVLPRLLGVNTRNYQRSRRYGARTGAQRAVIDWGDRAGGSGRSTQQKAISLLEG